jgi:hypothetical protein
VAEVEDVGRAGGGLQDGVHGGVERRAAGAETLIAGGAALDAAVDAILEATAGTPHIFNLGHGRLPSVAPRDEVADEKGQERAWCDVPSPPQPRQHLQFARRLLEHIPTKWIPVRRKKIRQNQRLRELRELIPSCPRPHPEVSADRRSTDLEGGLWSAPRSRCGSLGDFWSTFRRSGYRFVERKFGKIKDLESFAIAGGCSIALLIPSCPRPHPEVSADRRSTDLEGGLWSASGAHSDEVDTGSSKENSAKSKT